MPEGLEAEIWRRALTPIVGRTVESIWVDRRVADDHLVDVMTGRRLVGVRRHGKVVMIDTDGPTLGLQFGMTGRLVIDGAAPIERLEYSSDRDEESWDRLRLRTGGGPEEIAVRMNDPRRLGRIRLDPSIAHLGVDLFAVDADTLARACGRRRAAIKATLLDQSVVAGLGNLCADEVLWWAGIAPTRPTDDLTDVDIHALSSAIRRRMPIMLRRGGSTTGSLSPAVRSAPEPCPRDGSEMLRATVAGRTAVWCPEHQR